MHANSASCVIRDVKDSIGDNVDLHLRPRKILSQRASKPLHDVTCPWLVRQCSPEVLAGFSGTYLLLLLHRRGLPLPARPSSPRIHLRTRYPDRQEQHTCLQCKTIIILRPMNSRRYLS